MVRFHLPGIAVLLLALAAPCEARADDKKPPMGKAVNPAAAALIDKLVEVADTSRSLSPFHDLHSYYTSASSFAPLQRRQRDIWEVDPKPTPPVNVFRELVKLGPAAVPDLLAHLGDKRPTRLTVRNGFGPNSLFKDENDKNEESPDPYTVKVGDLCYVALGQIVNRQYHAAEYQWPKMLIVFSPTRNPKTCDALKKEWGNLTPEKHRQSLLKDCENRSDIETLGGAFLRLGWYHPDALEDPALQLLARPTYDVEATHKFVRENLYAETDLKKCRELFAEYVKEAGDAASDGIRETLYADLSQLETIEENNLQPNKFGEKPRKLLIELYCAPKTVKAKDKPIPDSISSENLAALIGHALAYDRSAKIDRAVRDLLAKTTDNRLALACMQRLVGRGFDDDIAAYYRRRKESLTEYQDQQFKEFLGKAGWTPLHVAVWREQNERLAELLREGAKVNAAAKDGRTPLHVAAAERDSEATQPLLKAGADLTVKDAQGRTPVAVAAFKGNNAAVRQLVAAGGPISDILVAATVGKTEEVAEFLRTDKEALRAKDWAGLTPLHRAAGEGQLKVMRLLLDAGAEADSRNDDGWTPLHVAAVYGRADACALLLERKARVDRPLDSSGTQPIHFAAMHGRLEVVKLLVEKGANVDARDHRKCAPLHEAAAEGRLAVVKWLVEHKADINAEDEDGNTPLYYATTNGGHEDVAEFLSKHGAKSSSGKPRGLGD
jgi:ankyrin repeat protein